MKDQATQRPWNIGKSLGNVAICTDTSHIATVHLEHAHTPRASAIVNEANARLIVRDELVEALNKARWFLQGETPPTIDANTIIYQIEQALAKAESNV